MDTFQSINDDSLAQLIGRAQQKIVYVAPGVGKVTVDALKRAIESAEVSVTIIIDSDEDAYRIGYGEHQALSTLHEVAKSLQFPVRRQAGLRIGMLITDEDLVIWAPTARSVEPERQQEQPNAIVLKGPVVQKMETAVGSDESNVLVTQAEIGREALRPEVLKKTVESLMANPPAPFDLAQKTRVFSTRFQFVEFEVRGAEWTGRQIRLSNLMLNADLPEELQDVLGTKVRPFQTAADIAFDVPLIVGGELAYRKDGT